MRKPSYVNETYDLVQGAIHRFRVRLCPEKARGLFEKLLIKHKICTFHVYIVL